MLPDGQVRPAVGSWSAAIGNAFLQPYDLNSDASTFTATGTAGPVHQQALGQLPPVEVAVYTYEANDAAATPQGNAGGRSAILTGFAA